MILQLLSVVLLARLLTPYDYGLVAMVLAIVAVGNIFRDFGLSAAAVQATSLSETQRANLFWLNTMLGGILTLIIFLCAPLIGSMYSRPELTGIARLLAFTFLINGAATQYRAGLNRDLRFKILAIADTLAPLVSLVVALCLAVGGATYWAIVAQQLVAAGVMLAVVVLGAGWLPARARFREPMDGLLKFGWTLAAAQFIGYLGKNADALVIGTRFGAAPLGIYNRTFQLIMMPVEQVRSPSTTVALPILSRTHSNEILFNTFLIRGQLALGYSLACGLFVVAGAAGPVTGFLLGDSWAAVVPVMRLLALAAAFQTLAYVGYWVYLSRGLTTELLRYTVVTTILLIICILAGSKFGVTGVAAGYLAASCIEWPLSLWWLSRRVTIPTRELYSGAGRILSLSAFLGATAYSLSFVTTTFPILVQFFGVMLGAAGVYVFLGWGFRLWRRDLLLVARDVRRGVLNRR